MANNWTKEEHILAFNLYCKIPFSKINSNYPPVVELALILGRSNGSVAMKLANFARHDPTLRSQNISGLTQGAKGELDVWNEFHNNWEELSFQSESLLKQYRKTTEKPNIDQIKEPYDFEQETERITTVKARVNQQFFRQMVLASYNYQCAVTGCKIPNLLTACHIIPWGEDAKNRMNPRNGICMNIFHHKAFDEGLFTISQRYEIVTSPRILHSDDHLLRSMLVEYNGRKIIMPQKFSPAKEFLCYHNESVFLKH